MYWDRSPAALLCDSILKFDGAANFAPRPKHHAPGQFGYFGCAKASLYREQYDQAIALRMARALGEEEEIVDMIGRKRLGLFACHVTQNEYLSILECSSQRATEISRPS